MTPASEHRWRLPYLVGCAVECARWVLPLCREDHTLAELACDFAEAGVRGTQIDASKRSRVSNALMLMNDRSADKLVVLSGLRAAMYLEERETAFERTARNLAIGRATDHAIAAIENAKDFIGAGAVQILEARWILRDLNDGDVPEHLQDAAMGALSISIELAREVLGVSPR